jgi:hypothetical protein
MTGRRLFIFLEGNDDQRFFSRIIRPLFSGRYGSVELILYASMKSVRVCKFIRSVKAMGHDYMVVADIDQEHSVREKKQVIQARFCDVDPRVVVVIIQEIESWYLAGIDSRSARELGVRPVLSTDQITKEHFNRRIPARYPSRIAFMLEILARFSIPEAMARNRSFHYFMVHYHLDAGSHGEQLPGKDMVAGEEAAGAGQHTAPGWPQ